MKVMVRCLSLSYKTFRQGKAVDEEEICNAASAIFLRLRQSNLSKVDVSYRRCLVLFITQHNLLYFFRISLSL